MTNHWMDCVLKCCQFGALKRVVRLEGGYDRGEEVPENSRIKQRCRNVSE
jgi:hypothetical protein